MKPPRALLLDAGWTLIHPHRSIWEIFQEIGAEHGAASSAVEIESLVHRLMTAAPATAPQRLAPDARYSDSNEEFRGQFEMLGAVIFSTMGLADRAAPFTRRFLEEFWATANWTVYPEVLGALDALREDGYRLGVVSNAGTELADFLARLDVRPRLDFVVISAAEGTKKPDPRIFRRALDHAGVGAVEGTHLGDMFFEDVLGARNAGINAVLMDRGPLAMFPHHSQRTNVKDTDVETVSCLDEFRHWIDKSAARR